MPSGPWGPSGTARYRALLAYVRREGHVRVPRDHREDGLSLGIWVRNQRRLYRGGLLTPEQASTLQRPPGWVWRVGPTSPRHRREDMLQRLRGSGRELCGRGQTHEA